MSTAEQTPTPAPGAFMRPRVIRRTAANFPIRRIGNDYRGVGPAPDDQIPGNPMLSQLFCGISMFFPPGERFMIAAAKSVEGQITDPQLRSDIDAFVRQEAQHASEHSRANKHVAELVGLDSDTICREVNALWAFIETHASPRLRAGVTAATEHFTAIISETLLADEEFLDAIPEGEFKQMLVWHGIEECEHKAVVFDAYQEIGGSEFERIAIMALYTGPVVVSALIPVWRLLAAHQQMTNLAGWRTAVSMLLRRWSMPLTKRYLMYYRPGFHPNHLPTRHLEQYWRQRLDIIDDGQRTA
jgi:predicted metal-dependent hydrolase